VRPLVNLPALKAHPRVLAALNDGQLELCVTGPALTIAGARAVCDAVRQALERGARSLILDVEQVVLVDAVGLASLLQCQRVADLFGAGCTLRVGDALHRALVHAKLVEEFVLEPRGRSHEDIARCSVRPPVGGAAPTIATGAQVSLRPPRAAETVLFRQWAQDPLVDQMVGSTLLYRCLHLPPDDPELVASILHDPRGLTFVVETPPVGRPPVGFVRLYDIDLVSGFAFLETVVADHRAMRKGLGIEASRFLLALSQDILGIRRVEAKVYAYNLLSINALKRQGFRQEGVLREARIYENQAWDILVFSILQAEIEQERRRGTYPYFGLWGDPPCSSTD
jgi:RimJ/RimL family protein N-acetyltransferase/anti-anti-sigma regulatory factor